MTEKEIQQRLSRLIDSRRHPYQIVNSYIYNWESDFWTLDSQGFTREYEIKISRADFLKDALKPKHLDMFGGKGPNYFYYVCPENLIKPDEVPKGYGLFYYTEHGISLIKRPAKLHSEKFTDYKLLLEKYYWKWWNLWRAKYISKEISYDEYKEGFNLELEQFDNESQKIEQ